MADRQGVKKITAGLVFSWIFGVLFLLAGIGLLAQGSYVAGVIVIVCSAMILPPFNDLLREKWHHEISGGIKWLLVIVILITIGVGAGTAASRSSISNDPSLQTLTKAEAPVPGSAGPEAPVAAEGAPAPVAPSAPDKSVKEIVPQKPASVLTSPVYTEQDIEDVVAIAKGAANDQQQQGVFYRKYMVNEGDATVAILTPYANTAMGLAKLIERYDEYTMDDVRSLLSTDRVYTTAINLQTTEMYSQWDTSDLRAVIEIADGKICRGKITEVESKMGDIDLENTKVYYKTSISATFDCYNEIHDKNVKVVYIAGNTKTVFDVDMRDLK